MAAPGRSPADAATRSLCSPAQLATREAVIEPCEVCTTSAGRVPLDALDPDAEGDRAPSAADAFGQLRAHGGEVDHRGGRDVQGGPAGGVRLEIGQTGRPQVVDLDAVGRGPLGQGVEAGLLVGGGGHHHLAAPPPGHAVAVAPVEQLGSPRPAQLGLGRPRPVVEAGVHDSGVVAALVGGDPVLLVQHHHGQVRIGPLHGPGRGQPHDARADHHHVGRLGERGRCVRSAVAAVGAGWSAGLSIGAILALAAGPGPPQDHVTPGGVRMRRCRSRSSRPPTASSCSTSTGPPPPGSPGPRPRSWWTGPPRWPAP